jgi:YHS domain-containing protein
MKRADIDIMTTTPVIDPVCGMEVQPTATGAQSEYKGQTYRFCCSGCKGTFDRNPEQYTGKSAGAAAGKKTGCCCG